MTGTLIVSLLGGLLTAGAPVAQTVRDAAQSAGQGVRPPQPTSSYVLEAARATPAPEIDGRLDDASWASATPASGFLQMEPNAGSPASHRTEVRVLYDNDAIYVGARMYDPQPDSIAAQLMRRDGDGYSDWFHVGVDSYHDRRTAFVFGVNPRGVQRDFVIYNDNQEDGSWDAVWEAAAVIDSLGWSAELRIPLSQLRFDGGADASLGERTWGIDFQREVARAGEESLWAPIYPNSPGIVSLFGELTGLRGLSPPKRVEIVPYTRASATRAPGEAGDPFHSATDLAGAAGADVRLGLGSNLTLSATVNPDFGQVEADPSVVNLTAFESFFQERRPFFVEGNEIFRFPIHPGDDQSQQLFYSRRVGRSPQGSVPDEAEYSRGPEATTILAATKLSGKTEGGWSIGVLDAVTSAEHARYVDDRGVEGRTRVEPLANYLVARVKKDFQEGRSGVGTVFTATNREIADEGLSHLRSAAYTGGVDVHHRFRGGNYQVQAWLVGSHVRGSEDAIARAQRAAARYFQRPDADHLRYDTTRTSLSGHAASLMLAKIGGGQWRWGVGGMSRSPGFEVNDLGFQREADLAVQFGFLSYQSFRAGRVFRRWNVNLNQWSAWSFGGDRFETGGNVNGGFELANFWGGHGGVNRQFEALSTGALRGGPAIVQPGKTNVWLGLYTDRRKAVRGDLNANVSFEDETPGREVSLSPGVTIRPSQQLELSLRPSIAWSLNPWQYVTQREADGGKHYVFGRLDQTTASLTTRLAYTLTPTLSLELYAQPFISAGDYTDFRAADQPRAERFSDRFRAYQESELGYDLAQERYRVLRGDASTQFTFKNPDFNLRQLRSNVVLRWEYRPGSTLFVVWSQARSSSQLDGPFDLSRDVDRLFGADGTNVLLVKVSYWLAGSRVSSQSDMATGV
ncbi:MAG: carbohydrate binding family 9 domain-containing protein, partial [Gemmatimonadetes bacterium]|nr:carbohydrate binding family 9 domain-containing protein [Gemmatimonadota bacterium]